MEGAQNSKSRSRNPLPDHFGPTFEFLSLAPLMFNIHAKFAVSSLNRSGDMEGSQNSKSRSRDPFPTALAYFWIFIVSGPHGACASVRIRF